MQWGESILSQISPEQAAPSNSDHGAASGTRVLVVEDDEDAAFILGTVLKLHGYDVCVQPCGSKALEAITGFVPQVAILDIGLPEMDGWQLARQLRRQLGSQKPVLIALTGYGQEEYRRKSAEAGFDHHLLKSIAPDELLAVLQQSLRQRPGP